jgi:hypothetical protein
MSNDDCDDSDDKPAKLIDNPEQRADDYSKLAKSAWDRFHSRRDGDWKMAIGLWTLFGGGIVGVATARMPLPREFFWWALGGTFIIVSAYGAYWLPYIADRMQRDARTSYYWESGIQNLLQRHVPPGFEPNTVEPPPANQLWVTMPAEGEDDPQKPTKDEVKCLRNLHESQKCLLGIVVGLAVIFLGILWARTPSRPGADSRPKVTIEGQFELESASKVKLSR